MSRQSDKSPEPAGPDVGNAPGQARPSAETPTPEAPAAPRSRTPEVELEAEPEAGPAAEVEPETAEAGAEARERERPGARAAGAEARAPGLARVAIVGRPNVGKSTLVNRLLGRRAAITQELPGVTRDRVAYEAEWDGRRFDVVDTGGWEPHVQGLAASVVAQAERAIAEADLVLLVVDAQAGVAAEVHPRLPERPRTDAPPRPPAVAIVGRPNVGKSSLLNRLAGGDVAIVDPT